MNESGVDYAILVAVDVVWVGVVGVESAAVGAVVVAALATPVACVCRATHAQLACIRTRSRMNNQQHEPRSALCRSRWCPSYTTVCC